MKTYKDFEKKFIGISDSAALIVAGCTGGGLKAEVLKFLEDGSYYAYIVDGTVEIPEHYDLKLTFTDYIRVYDDSEKTFEIDGKTINIYRSGSFGCIIQVL